MVTDYWNEIYVPAADRGRRFRADNFEIASRVGAYKRFIRDSWPAVHVNKVEILDNHSSRTGLHKSSFIAKVDLGPIWHKDVRVEAVGSDGRRGIWRSRLELVQQLSKGMYIYEGISPDIPIHVWRDHMNVRVTPVSPDFANDFEMELAAWG
jgi:starch phosphorylase